MQREEGIEKAGHACDSRGKINSSASEQPPVKNMFHVDISFLREHIVGNQKGVESQAGVREGRSDHDTTHIMADHFDSPTPYPCLASRIMLVHMNVVSLLCVGLAVGVALFSSLLHVSLQMVGNDDAQYCSITSGNEATKAATIAARSQLYNGVNATLWNMEHSAIFGLTSALENYKSASTLICQARELAVGNISEASAEWTTAMIFKARKNPEILLTSPQAAEYATPRSEYSDRSAGNASSAFKTDIPVDSVQLECKTWLTRNVSDVDILYFKSRVNAITQRARSGLYEIMKNPLTSANNSQSHNLTGIAQEGDFGLQSPTKAWVTIFSIASVIAIIPAALREYSFWHYEIATAEVVRGQPHVDLLETFHELMHYEGTLMSKWLSGLILRSNDRTRMIWVRWALNYAFCSSLNRLLYLGFYFALLAVANSSLTKRAEIVRPASVHCAVLDRSLYIASLQSLNKDIVSLILLVLKDLNANHDTFLQSLRDATGVNVFLSSPFESGVALEEASFYTPRLPEPSYNRSVANNMVDLLDMLNSAFWLSSIILFALWALFASFACVIAGYKIHKAPDPVN